MRSVIRRSVLALVASVLSCSLFAFDLQGHRGARGLAPENTLAAFERALELGVGTLELDLGMTADGVLVVTHDPALNAAITRDASGQWLPARGPLVKSLTSGQLQAWDVGRIDPASAYARTFSTQRPVDGARIPTLAQVFELVRSRGAPVRFNIETKLNPHQPQETATPEAMVDALLAAIRAAGVRDRISIQSFDWRTLQRVQQLEPGLPTVYLTIQTMNNNNVNDPAWTAGARLADHGSVPRLVKALGGAAWSPNQGALTQALVQEAQALGLKVLPWTVNAPADMERFIGWGVDGIITDYPDRLRAVMQRMGVALPAPAPAR